MQLLILGSVALCTEPCALLCTRIGGLSNFVGAMLAYPNACMPRHTFYYRWCGLSARMPVPHVMEVLQLNGIAISAILLPL